MEGEPWPQACAQPGPVITLPVVTATETIPGVRMSGFWELAAFVLLWTMKSVSCKCSAGREEQSQRAGRGKWSFSPDRSQAGWTEKASCWALEKWHCRRSPKAIVWPLPPWPAAGAGDACLGGCGRILAQQFCQELPFHPNCSGSFSCITSIGLCPVCPLDQPCSTSGPGTDIRTWLWSVLSGKGELVQSGATQHVLLKWLQLFYEATLGFSAACAGPVTAVTYSSCL